jgi:hypothetical protein
VEYICRQLEQLDIIKHIPDADVPPDYLINRATDVLSATLTYLAVHIHHQPGRFGVIGRLPNSRLTDFVGAIVGTIIKGDEESVAVDTELQDAVAEFNSALTNFASRIGFRTFQVGTQTLEVSMRGLDVGMRTLEIVDGGTLSTANLIQLQVFDKSKLGARTQNRSTTTTSSFHINEILISKGGKSY